MCRMHIRIRTTLLNVLLPFHKAWQYAPKCVIFNLENFLIEYRAYSEEKGIFQC